MNIKDVNVLERLLPNQNLAKEMSQKQVSGGFEKIYQNRIQNSTKDTNAFPEHKLEQSSSKKTNVASKKQVMTKEKEFDSRKTRPADHKVLDEEVLQKVNVKKPVMVQGKELTAEFESDINELVEELTEMTEMAEVKDTEEVLEPVEAVLSPLAQFAEALIGAVDDLETKLQGIKEQMSQNGPLTPVIETVLSDLEASVAKLKETLIALQNGSQTNDPAVSKLLTAVDALKEFNETLTEAVKTIGKEQAKSGLKIDDLVDLKEIKVFQQLKELQHSFKAAIQTPLIHLQAKPILEKLESADAKATEMIQSQIEKMTEVKKTSVVSTEIGNKVASDPKPEEQVQTTKVVKADEAEGTKKGLAFSTELHKVEGEKSKFETTQQKSVHLEQIGTPIDKQVIRLNDKAVESNPLFKSILSQVQDGMKASLKVMKDGSEMVMKLKPETLGEVLVKITIHKNTVIAEMQVQSQIVKEALESSLNDLRNTLKDKGFNVDQLNVSVGQENTSNNGQEQSRYARQSARYPHQISMDDVDLPLLERAKSFINNGKLDYFA